MDSREFFNYAKPFFTYLIKFYNYGKYDDEILAACYTRLIGACKYGLYKADGTYIPPYYDDTRVNIATFVHSVVRNHIVSKRYRLKKFVDCFESSTATMSSTSASDYDWENLFDYDEIKDALIKEARIVGDGDTVSEFISEASFDNPVKRAILWQISKSNFLLAETR